MSENSFLIKFERSHPFAWFKKECNPKTLGTAILIITLLGSLTAFALGMGGLGVDRGWWSAASLSFDRTYSLLLIGFGGAGIIVCTLVLIIKKIHEKRETAQSHTIIRTLSPNHEANLTTSNDLPSNTLIPPDQNLQGDSSTIKSPTKEEQLLWDALDTWINEVPNDSTERVGRIKAAAKIKKCSEKKSPHLNLSYCHLTSLPKEIGSLVHLKRLHLDNNNLTELPNEMEHLIDLEHLNVANNQLKEFRLYNLINLKNLQLSGNNIKTLPEEMKLLKNLQILHLENNKLGNFPAVICTLSRLISLNLSCTHILSLPEEMGQLTHLMELSIWNSHPCLGFSEFPTVLCCLTELRNLILVGHHIASLPKEIQQLNKLIELELCVNEFTKFPLEICNCRALKRFTLSYNRLTTLPEEIEQLKNLEHLEYLELKHNQISSLPNQIKSLPSTLKVFLDANCFPPDVIAHLDKTLNAQGYTGPTITYSTRTQ